jgi:peptidoglycan/xylan/chitin deacetylase (PgdA/CDA1 family)
VSRRRIAATGLVAAVVAVLAAILIESGSGAIRRRPPPRSTIAATTPGGVRPRHEALAQEVAVRRLVGLGRPVYCGGTRGHTLAFTFDDGPGPYTHYALKKLRQARERATFFAVGRSIANFPGWLPRELKVGVIGDHTYTHPLLTALPAAAVRAELARTAAVIRAQTGEHVELFRPPYGAHNATVDRIAHRLGLLEILWNVDSADSLGANRTRIIKNVEAGMRPGAIILMHENRGQTIRALTTLLPALRRRHLRSVTVPELLRADPPSRAQVRRGQAGCVSTSLRGSGG